MMEVHRKFLSQLSFKTLIRAPAMVSAIASPADLKHDDRALANSAQHRIQSLLDRIEAERGIRILYACESGSRAWGFASPDSDYDIRFVFAHPEKAYLQVVAPCDSIDLPLINGDLDAGGWDARKALGLLGKSNGALVEWLHSPIVYRKSPGFPDRWRMAAREVFSPKHSVDHYRGLAKQMVFGKLNTDAVRAKDYLYALRAILAAEWVLDGRGIPPVPFAELLPVAPSEVRALVPELLEHKARTMEGERMARIPVLDAFLDRCLTDSAGRGALLPSTPEARSSLDWLFRREIRIAAPELAEDYTLERVRRGDVLLFESVAGSRAYGTNLDHSDEDLRGVFAAAAGLLGGLDGIEQVSDDRGDLVYYELGRLVELLLRNNPNALELIAMPEDCVRFRHPLFERLVPSMFLSKLCEKTYGEYAMGQIRKARGLNKKIVNPQPEKRHPLLSFCRVPAGQGSVPLLDWLEHKGIPPAECGLTAVRNAAGMFAIYQAPAGTYRGLVSPKDPDALVFTSVPKEAEPVGWMHCNEDAFKAHCKAHREYWQWVQQRNEERYRNNASHGRGYDSKNLMHTIRLLEMAGEIAREGVLRVRRPNRDFLLEIRSGAFDYETLVARAEELHSGLESAFASSGLPDAPDRYEVNALLVELREEFRIR
jgi:predicted nucleotidyltransferase